MNGCYKSGDVFWIEYRQLSLLIKEEDNKSFMAGSSLKKPFLFNGRTLIINEDDPQGLRMQLKVLD